jgi:hypothetical protein
VSTIVIAVLPVLLALPAACAQTPTATVASNPPPVPPGPAASGSRTPDARGQLTVGDITSILQRHPDEIATIVGKTDTVGSPEYNMHLSHLRADTVRRVGL